MGFAREAALLNQQPENSPPRRLFEQKTGITTQSFLDLALAAYTAILSGSTVLDASWFAPIRAAYTEPVVDAFIRVISRDYFQLRDFFRALPDRDPKRASEYYEFPVSSAIRFYGQEILWSAGIQWSSIEALRDLFTVFSARRVRIILTTLASYSNPMSLAKLRK
jgi:hypothetical protein